MMYTYKMREKGKVIEKKGEYVKISLQASQACKNCPSSNFCQPTGNTRVVDAEDKIGVNVGDDVYIEISPKLGLTAMFLLFGLPIILALIGLVAFKRYGEFYSAISGVIGLIVGLIVAKIINDVHAVKHVMIPHVVEVVISKES